MHQAQHHQGLRHAVILYFPAAFHPKFIHYHQLSSPRNTALPWRAGEAQTIPGGLQGAVGAAGAGRAQRTQRGRAQGKVGPWDPQGWHSLPGSPAPFPARGARGCSGCSPGLPQPAAVPRPVCCVTAGIFIEPPIQGAGLVDYYSSMNKTWIFSWLQELRAALDLMFHSGIGLSC